MWDVENQNCEYEERFKKIAEAAAEEALAEPQAWGSSTYSLSLLVYHIYLVMVCFAFYRLVINLS